MDVLKLLEDVKNDKVSLEEAAKELKQLPYEDLGFAKLDHHRQIRSGFGEVVFCSGKSDEHLLKIYETFYKTDTEVLGTRASEHQYELVKAVIPEVTYDPLSRILKIEKPGKERIGRVAVCTAGTADIAVAEEAAQVAEYFGTNVDRFYDVGVAGIHRLFAKLEEIRKANCIIAVAGMEGALGGVLAGLVEVPVIAVPTSIGYGANFGGLSALLTMLNSCSNGITVVNIDNGYGAGYISTQINRLAVKAYKPETNSVCSGQVLHCPYDFDKAKLVVKEMTDLMVLDLVDKGLVTDQIVLTIGYDIENLTDPDRSRKYKGNVTIDRYGRRVPKHAHGTTNLKRQTSSTMLITDAVMELYDRIVDENLLIRRINITANRLVDENSAKKEEKYEQLDLFTDYKAKEQEQVKEEADLEREKRMQQTMLTIKKKFGKNAILKGMNLQEGATAKDRNEQIGGHKA